MILAGREEDGYFGGLGPANSANDFLTQLALELRRDAVIFDVGANIGYTTALLGLLLPDSRIFSF